MMVNPRQKGWLKEYLDVRKDQFLKHGGEDVSKIGRHPDESLYSIVQPSGLMYGQPINLSGIGEEEQLDWDDESKLKVLLAESFINSSFLFHEKNINSAEDFSEMIVETTSGISRFYNEIYPEISTSTKSFFGKKKSPLEVAEKIIDKRIGKQKPVSGEFWDNFFQNSLLFLDIFVFGQWVHTNSENVVAEYFRQEKEDLRFSVVKVLAAASHANNHIETEERRLFEYFINSSDLSSVKKAQAYRYLEEGVDLEEVVLPATNSWILRKYFLELAILVIWIDKRVEDSEREFLEKFRQLLGFSNDDFENSMIAIEGFVLEHWQELDYLQNKKDFESVSDEFISRVARITDRNKSRIANQLKSNKEVAYLLRKLNNEGLETHEKEQLKNKLITILKNIPSFVIVTLPSKFLSLPVLLKILQKEINTN
ncbi:MAG: TerB family tellurite resistance protein [Cyclobacteriaceae bacterium]|nr:TerB family tellurite resistance protein [Cyclobacteriaceae bacterium]